ncbi:hypothetical protein PHYPSEUDO_013634 [Phytophthora pseudosyringae]|uniref:Uncharacterized protein n=1 Tax=Phytophthora pseudosyringae TaxID=221518 RepID=A0A8T1W6Q9_9STRA|nr:hypothetical protein PHYPSEUDO_013634 [Phytophthora pseudosyringae]
MTATPPLPTLEVASAAYFHLECGHEQLFHSEYKRCFPHCCPEHIDRSYCGTSLSVRVELETRSPDIEPTGPPPSEVLAVFARFEAVSDVSLRPGECVEVAKMAACTQSEKNLEGRWVGGTLDRPSGLVTTIRTPGTAPDDHKPLVFHLNRKPFSRWYYDWESGANKAQRLTKHVLKAYPVERCAIDEDGNFTAYTSPHAHTQLYRVLHVVVSPEFTVISYRRAPSEQYQETSESGMPLYAENVHHRLESRGSLDSSYSPDSRVSVARTTELRPPVVVKPDPFYCEVFEGKRQRISPSSAQPFHSVETTDLLEDRLRWEHANAQTVSVSRNLALVYAFLRWAPLSTYAPFADELVDFVHQQSEEKLASFPSEISRLNFFSKLLLDHTGPGQGTTEPPSFDCEHHDIDGSPTPLPPALQMLLRAVAQATLWLFSAETTQWLRAFFQQYAASALDKNALRACFVLFVQELQDRLDAYVFERTELGSLANVAEEVIAAVYSYPYFHERRPQVRRILSGRNFVGWDVFVAQMRQSYIGMSESPGVLPHNLARDRPGLTFSEAHLPRNAIESDWNAEWLLDVDEALWKPSCKTTKVDIHSASSVCSDISDDKGAVTLVMMLGVISQLVRVEVALDAQASTLHFRSEEGVAGALSCMTVLLDGRDRVFAQFPNGIASGIGMGTHGDYIGEMRVGRAGRLVVYLQIFNWSVHENSPSSHVRMRIECWQSHRLRISGDVLATTAPASFSAEDIAYVGEMPLRAKREAVEKSFAKQLQQVRASRRATAPSVAPWTELGKFRLSYTKV